MRDDERLSPYRQEGRRGGSEQCIGLRLCAQGTQAADHVLEEEAECRKGQQVLYYEMSLISLGYLWLEGGSNLTV